MRGFWGNRNWPCGSGDEGEGVLPWRSGESGDEGEGVLPWRLGVLGDGVGEITGFSHISLNRECFILFRFFRSS